MTGIVGIAEVNRARINAALPPYAEVLDVESAAGSEFRKVYCPWCGVPHVHERALGAVVAAPCRERFAADASYVIGLPEYLAP